MREQVILAFNDDGEVAAVVRPVDPLNPQFTQEEMSRFCFTELINVSSFTEFLELAQ